MKLGYSVECHNLKFIKPVKTSRNSFEEKNHWVIKIWNKKNPDCVGIGEAAPLELLSPDFRDNLGSIIEGFLLELAENKAIEELDLEPFPSVKFAIECAFLDLRNGGKQVYFESNYLSGSPILINGLVWMNELDEMLKEGIAKAEAGFKCIKFKIGQHDFDAECRLIEKFRNTIQGKNTVIRLDANGAFRMDDALEKLKELHRFHIHSIEQPIMAGHWDEMAKICMDSKIDIALDEELIGVQYNERQKLLKHILPHFIILKPTLLGGFAECEHWISLAKKGDIGWWATSALESNIGLNAIAQWVGKCNTHLHQGLGTGKLYKTNFESKSDISEGRLIYKN